MFGGRLNNYNTIKKIQSSHILISRWESFNKVHGRTSNPYDANRIVGGSSGGEGAIQAGTFLQFF